MTARQLTLLLVALMSISARPVVAGPHARHVFFDNSPPGAGYYHSSADVTIPSRLEIAQGKIPVDDSRSLSPPNSLKLAWTSSSGGDWHARIKVANRYGHRFRFEGDVLSFWCYSAEGLSVADSPRIAIASPRGSVPWFPFLEGHGDLPAGKWVEVRIALLKPTGIYKGTEDSSFDPAALETIEFVQNLDDERPHTLWIDDVRIVPANLGDDKTPPATPAGFAAEGWDRHIDLSWQSVADVASYRIERSRDGREFQPLLTRAASFTRAVDFPDFEKASSAAGQGGGPSFTYRVVAIDAAGNESPPSEPAKASTRPLTDDELLTMVQRACFRYYWDAAHPAAGMAIEILPGDENLVALGASGFGVGALVVGAERGFAPREEVAARVLKIVRFLDKADRFHGVWPHFLDGNTGRVNPFFGKYDDGGDLVETAFMMQGLLIARQYFDGDTSDERAIRETVDRLWREVEWDWFRREPDGPVLYWHWSPNHAWHISHPLIGWNETMIIYLLAIASPTHGVPAELYHTGFAGQSDMAVDYRRGWSRTTHGDHFTNGRSYYGIPVDVGCGNGAELFFNQFSFHGFDPRGKRDRYTNYFRNNRHIALVSREYAIDNPLGRVGYGADCWGRSAGVNSGGGRSLPKDDNGTICCSASLGVFPFTPAESLSALKHFYRELGPKCWGVYGFHDGFNETQEWFEEVYMGLNQAQIVVMIENHRTGLPWKCFMANPEMQPMLDKLGFEPDPVADDAP
jgi:hypothetical protein